MAISDLLRIIGRIRVVPNFGFIPDPYDARDAGYSFSNTRSNRLSSNVGTIDNSQFFKEISMQLDLPACVGNASADFMEALDIQEEYKKLIGEGKTPKMALSIAKRRIPNYSRMFIWWNARNEMDPPRHKNASYGTHNRLAMDVMSRFGVPREDLWPYDKIKLPPKNEPRTIVRPSLTAYRDARSHVTKSYHAFLVKDDDRLDQIVKSLQVVPGVLFGADLCNGFFGYKGGVLYKPSRRMNKWHAMVLCGYERDKASFRIRNSWGLDWGEDGYGLMHESYVSDDKYVRSLWVATKGVM